MRDRSSRAREVLGWEPKVEILDGLRRSVDFYRKLGEGEVTR